MSNAIPPAAPAAEPTPAQLLADGDIVGLMRVCHGRRLEREGVPMVLGLADERGVIPACTNLEQLAEGERFGAVFDPYAEALVPWARPDDEDAVITAMQVLAYTHFAPGAEPITDATAPVGAEGA